MRESRTLTEPSSGCTCGLDPTSLGHLLDAEDKHFWFRTRNQVIGTLVRQILPDEESDYRILELGCGTGNVLRVLEQACPHGYVVGLDLFAEGLQYARRRTSCDLVRGDANKLPFCARFDLVGLFDVLEHSHDDTGMLRDIHYVLRPHGRLMLTVPAHPSLWSYFDEASRHHRRYRPSELKNKLIGTGYSVEYLTQFMASILPLVWAKRRVMTRIGRETKRKTSLDMALGEMRIVPFANDLLTFLLSQEAHLLLRRSRLPFGTSLLAIARPMVK